MNVEKVFRVVNMVVKTDLVVLSALAQLDMFRKGRVFVMVCLQLFIF